MAFRLPKGWMLAASPRRNARQPFRRTLFPREQVDRASIANAGINAAAAPAGAPGMPWWRALLDALGAVPRAHAVAPANQRADDANERQKPPSRRDHPTDGDSRVQSGDAWRPVTERLDRQREQLSGIDEHLRRLVELQIARDEATAVYAPPA